MIKLILLSIQFIILIILAGLAVNNSYVVSIEYKDFIFSTSSSYIIASIIFIILIIFIFQSIYFKFRNNINEFKSNNKIKNKEKGYDAFMNGMIAIVNKDFKKAVIENRKVAKYLNDSTLHLLLKSETLKIEKKFEELSNTYEEMIANEKTKILGLRGLMEQYLRSQDYHHALIYGENLFKISPNIEKLYDTLVYIIGKTSNWQNLLSINEKAFSMKIIDKNIFSINKSIAFYEIAKIKKLDSQKEALKLMEKALDLRKNFAPYNSFYIDLLILNNKLNFARKFVSKIWNFSPHPDYKPKIKALSEKLNIDYDIFVKEITMNTKNQLESKILKAESLIYNEKWEAAKNELSPLLEHKPKKEICLLMSKIEEGDTNDPQKIDAWISRANYGEISNIWVCRITNISQENWSSVSNGGYFNSLEWTKPKSFDENLSPSFAKNKIGYIV